MIAAILDSWGWIAGGVLGLAFVVFMVVCGTPRHAVGCKNPHCRGCSGGPN